MTDPNDNLPDDYTLWRCIAVGLCMSACIVIAACGGVWAAFYTVT